jgi:hypothetical protein
VGTSRDGTTADALGHADVILEEGYNLTITEILGTTPAGLPQTTLVLNARSGAGAGQAPGCSDTAPTTLQTINGQRPDSAGNFNFQLNQCQWIQPDLDVITERWPPKALKLGNDCKACCSCQDFLQFYYQLVQEYHFWELLSDQVEALRLQYQQATQTWEAQHACRDGRALSMTLRVNAPHTVDATFRFNNPTANCLTGVTLSFHLAGNLTPVYLFASDGCFMTDASHYHVPITLSLSGTPSYTWASVPANGTVELFVRYTLLNVADGQALTLHGTVTGTQHVTATTTTAYQVQAAGITLDYHNP